MQRKVKDLVFILYIKSTADYNLFVCNLNHSERIVVSDRVPKADGTTNITTWYNKDNEYWIVSSTFDIRNYPELSLQEAINMIKAKCTTWTRI